jgi:outer membrane cobalamin receptor
MGNRYFLIGLAFILGGASAVAQDPVVADSTILLKEGVVITAQRMATSSNAVAEAVVTTTLEEIVRLPSLNTPDVMATMPGVWMQKTNHGGGSPFIRGLTGYYTLILTDGIRFNNSTFRSGPNQYLVTVDQSTLQRIEVLRGQGSVQYGSDAIGGVAQLFFREPRFTNQEGLETTGRLDAQYMNHYMEYAGRAEVELNSKNFGFLGGIGYKQLGDIKAGGDLGTLSPTGFIEFSWDVKAKAKVGSMELTGVWQHVVQEDVPLYHQVVSGSYTRYHFNPQQRDLGYIRLASTNQSKLFSQVRYTIAYLNSLEVREKQRTGSSIFRTERDKVDTYHGGVEIISDFSSRWKASSGVEVYHDYVTSSADDTNLDTDETSAARGLYPDGTTYTNLALYSVHALDIKRFSFTLGGRYNIVQLTVDDPDFGVTKVNPQALVGNAGVVFNVMKGFQLLASANTGFRAPNVNDVSSFGVADYRYEVPNYNLAPEKSFQYQAGIRTQLKQWKAEVFVYQNHLKDLISNVPSTYNGQDSLDGVKVYKKENVNKAFIKGIEFSLQYKPVRWLSTFGNITYTVGDNTTRDEPLSRIPPVFGRVGADIRFKGVFTWRTEFIAAGEQDRLSSGDKADSRIQQGGTPGWAVVNTRLEFDYRNVRLNTGLQNIFDEAYRVHGSGVDGVGRSFWVSVIFEFSTRGK